MSTDTMPPLTEHLVAPGDWLGWVLTDYDRGVVTGLMMRANGAVEVYLNGNPEPEVIGPGEMVAVEELASQPSAAARVALAKLLREAEELAAGELAIEDARERERGNNRADTHGLPSGEVAPWQTRRGMAPWGAVVHQVGTDDRALCGIHRPEGWVSPEALPAGQRIPDDCKRCKRQEAQR